MSPAESRAEPGGTTRSVSLASTIGPIDAGIVPAHIDAYRAASDIVITLTGAGTGKTLDLARDDGFDVVIVHARRLEEQFIADGYGLARAPGWRATPRALAGIEPATA